MPMSIQMERHSECKKTVLTGTPIPTYTNPLPTPIRMSAMSTIGINTPTNLTPTPRNPLKTPSSQVLALGNQALMNRTAQQGHPVTAHLITEVMEAKAND